MKSLTKQLVAIICLSSSLFAGTASASDPQGGVIHFVGSIVEDPCDIAETTQHISMSCYRNGKVNTATVSYQQVMNGRQLNDDRTTVSMRYINPQKTLGIVTVAYR